jgi:hypothetical protein
MSIIGTDPFDTLIYQQSLIGTPLVEGKAAGADDLDVPQRAVTIGEVVPIAFGRRRDGAGGVFVSPPATEARFENDENNAVTAYYHVILSEGNVPPVEVRDLYQRSCRVGTFSQAYNRRAGPWIPGNFIVPRPDYDKPECPYYCGTGGTYADMTTGSFIIPGVPDGDSRWDRQIHAFLRGGMQLSRILDFIYGPSDCFVDLLLYLLRKTARITDALIDFGSLYAAADFADKLGLRFNGLVDQSANVEDLLASVGRDFLLTKTTKGGKFALKPLLPTTATNELNLGTITPVYTFTEDHIYPESADINWIPVADRRPFCALMLWRQQPEDDIGMVRTTEVRQVGLAEDGPFEQHDLSKFCATENHAVKSGAYRVAKRRYTSHTFRGKLRPGVFGETLAQGDIVRVRLNRIASSAASGTHDYLYEVDRIGKSRTGEVVLNLVHFPINEDGQSLVALEVANAVGGGLLLDTGKSGTSCDTNSATDTTPAPDDSVDDWILPDDSAFDALMPDAVPGDLGSLDGLYGDNGRFPSPNLPERLDDQTGVNPTLGFTKPIVGYPEVFYLVNSPVFALLQWKLTSSDPAPVGGISATVTDGYEFIDVDIAEGETESVPVQWAASDRSGTFSGSTFNLTVDSYTTVPPEDGPPVTYDLTPSDEYAIRAFQGEPILQTCCFWKYTEGAWQLQSPLGPGAPWAFLPSTVQWNYVGAAMSSWTWNVAGQQWVWGGALPAPDRPELPPPLPATLPPASGLYSIAIRAQIPQAPFPNPANDLLIAIEDYDDPEAPYVAGTLEIPAVAMQTGGWRWNQAIEKWEYPGVADPFDGSFPFHLDGWVWDPDGATWISFWPFATEEAPTDTSPANFVPDPMGYIGELTYHIDLDYMTEASPPRTIIAASISSGGFSHHTVPGAISYRIIDDTPEDKKAIPETSQCGPGWIYSSFYGENIWVPNTCD